MAASLAELQGSKWSQEVVTVMFLLRNCMSELYFTVDFSILVAQLLVFALCSCATW